MAIEVTKPGKLPEPEKLKGVCNWCKCEVLCLEVDTTYEAEKPFSDSGPTRSVKCPTKGCGRKIVVDYLWNTKAR